MPSRTNSRRPTARERRRHAARVRRWRVFLITALCVVGVTGILTIGGAVVVAASAFSDLGGRIGVGRTEDRADPPAPADPVARFSAEQLANAEVIMAAGRDLGLPLRDQAIAVMTAMGESSLRNIDYGDWETSGVTNPDGTRTTSIGLFQQQDSWGSREARLDPYQAAGLFYRAMLRAVPEPERSTLQPTIVAHRTQINRNPNHYARSWPAAVAVVERLSGQPVPTTD